MYDLSLYPSHPKTPRFWCRLQTKLGLKLGGRQSHKGSCGSSWCYAIHRVRSATEKTCSQTSQFFIGWTVEAAKLLLMDIFYRMVEAIHLDSGHWSEMIARGEEQIHRELWEQYYPRIHYTQQKHQYLYLCTFFWSMVSFWKHTHHTA